MTRDKFTIKFTKPVVSNKGGLQLSTPEIVAEYIAKRLKTDIIADLGCGIGGQVIFFAKECKKVYAVERDPEKIEYAKQNCELYGVDNVEFIQGDALSETVVNKVSDADIIFSDPARPLSEKERTLESLEPPITEIIRLYSKNTPRLAFHAPPQMLPSRLTFDCEREYLSLNGQLNRLTLYIGDLKRCTKSAVVLPGEFQLSSGDAPGIKASDVLEYVYEPEPSVMKAELLNELCQMIMGYGEKEKTGRTFDKIDTQKAGEEEDKEEKLENRGTGEKGNEVFLYQKDAKRALLTSDKLINSPFFKDRYRVLGKTQMDIPKMKRLLRAQNAKDVVLRFDIEPQRYWEIRKGLESGLDGNKTLQVFGFGDEIVVCEKIKLKS